MSAEQERAAVVAWLLEYAKSLPPRIGFVVGQLARAIERGDHIA